MYTSLFGALFFHNSIWAKVWFVNELLYYKTWWPAQPRFTKRPSAKNDVFTIDSVFVNLWFDFYFRAPWFNQVNCNFIIKCPITNDILSLHLLKVNLNDIFISSCSNDDVSISNNSV
jgi:hypothetical protein